MVTKAEMVGKIKAAVDTRRDADMVIIARSDARAVEGLQAAIDRVNAYLEAGADVGFVEAPQNAEELAAVRQGVQQARAGQHFRRRQDADAAAARARSDGLPHRHLPVADASRGDRRREKACSRC